MNELNKEKEEKEEEVRVLNEEVKERSNHVNDLNKNGSMNLNGLNEASVLNEEERRRIPCTSYPFSKRSSAR